jgi:hypothetical protein
VLYGNTQIHLVRPTEANSELHAAAQLAEPAEDPVIAAARGSEDNIIAMALFVVLRGVAMPEPDDLCPCRSGTLWKHCHASMTGNLELLISELTTGLNCAQRTTVERVTTPGGPDSFPAVATAAAPTSRARRGSG